MYNGHCPVKNYEGIQNNEGHMVYTKEKKINRIISRNETVIELVENDIKNIFSRFTFLDEKYNMK